VPISASTPPPTLALAPATVRLDRGLPAPGDSCACCAGRIAWPVCVHRV